MEHDLDAFFADYTDSYNQALGDDPDFDRIRGYFTDHFLAAGPEGVQAGKNDDVFLAQLKEGYKFYRAIRTRRMELRRVAVTPIDDGHVMARVFYAADYARPAGDPVVIDFDVTYLLETFGPRPRIFAFIAGDEMGLYRRHGLVDDQGRPR